MTSSRFDGRTYNGCTYDETTLEPIEPMPDWTVAKETWKWSWPVHVYGVSCLSLLLSVYASCSIVHNCYQTIRPSSLYLSQPTSLTSSPPTPSSSTLSLASTNSELTLVQSFVVLSCLFSAVHLFADPYESSCFEAPATTPFVRKSTRVLRFTSFPVMIGSTVCLQLVILRLSRVSLYPRCLQRFNTILSIFLLNLCILAAADCAATYVPSIRLLLLLSRGSAIWWALVVCFVFVYKGVQIANFADVARHVLRDACARNRNRHRRSQRSTRDGAPLATSGDGALGQRTMHCVALPDRTKDKRRRHDKALSMDVLRRPSTLRDDDESLQSDMTSVELSPRRTEVVTNGEVEPSISEAKRKRRIKRNHHQRLLIHHNLHHHHHHHQCRRHGCASRHRWSCDNSSDGDDQRSTNDCATDTTSTFIIHYRSDVDASRGISERLTPGDLNSPLSASSSYALTSFASPVSTTTALSWPPSVVVTDDLLNPSPGNGFESYTMQGRTATEGGGSDAGRTVLFDESSQTVAENGTSLIALLNNSWDNGYMGDTETPTLNHRSKTTARATILMGLFGVRRLRDRDATCRPPSATNTNSFTERRNSVDRRRNGISFINMEYSMSDRCCVADDEEARTRIDGEEEELDCRRFPLEQLERVSSATHGSLTLRALREGRSVERSLKAICSMALLLFICSILHMYAMFGVYGVLSKRKTLEPWPWYIYQTIVRSLELSIGLCVTWTAQQLRRRRRRRRRRRYE